MYNGVQLNSNQISNTCYLQDAELQSEVIIQLKNCQTASNKLLSLSKLCVADPTTPHLKNNLTQSARSLTDSINNLLNACTSSVPGQKECDNAIRNLEVCLKFISHYFTFFTPVKPISAPLPVLPKHWNRG